MSKEESSITIQEGKKKRLLKTDSQSQEKRMPIPEEDEACLRDPATDLESFHNSCDYLKYAIKNIKEMKKSGKDASAEMMSLQTDVSIQFIHMKKLNRLAHFRCRKVRETTNEAKHKIDHCHLQLQNLLYEAMHLQKEITKCMDFKSKDEEIELIPVEEFYRDAPESISNPALSKNDKHLERLARLEWELEQRKQLATKLTETKSNKEKISNDIQSKQDYLDTLQPKLSSILQATRPVQDYLDMPYDAIKEEHQKAQHLPMPLYILYMQTSAYNEACDKQLKVSIQGDVDAARALKSTAMFPLELDDDSDSDAEENEKANSKRRRKTIEIRKVEKKDRVLRKHPLNVILDITDKDGADLQLTFNYLMMLNIVTVNIKVRPGPKVTSTTISGSELLSDEYILDELYPSDHGNCSPNVANMYELKRHGLHEFSSYIKEVGRPYLWCQWMGGLQFLKLQNDGDDKEDSCDSVDDSSVSRMVACKAKHSISAEHMQSTITLLRERIRVRVALLHQLASLERGIIPIPAEMAKLFPTKVNSHLVSWRRSTYDDLRVLPHTQRFIKAGLVKPSDMVFAAVVERASAKMTAHVVLTANCPEVAPLFMVEIKWQSQRTALTDIHIMELEEEVNLHFQELSEGKCRRDHLLSGQLQRLLMCLDVYLETDTPASSTVPIEIPREKMMPRTARGRARSKPYKFVPELAIFTHRN